MASTADAQHRAVKITGTETTVLFRYAFVRLLLCAGLQPFGPKHRAQSKFAGLWKAEKKFKLVHINNFALYT